MKTFSSTTVQKVSDNIYVLTDKDMEMNSTLIIGKKDCILVDTRQNISLAKESQSAVKSITHKPIKYLINTHYHGDHTFGNQLFVEVQDIIGHKNTRATLLETGEQHKDFFRDFFGVSGTDEVVITPPTRTFENELSIQFDNMTIKIFHTDNAHTDTDCFIYIPEQKLLITGDLFNNRTIGFTGDPQCSLRGWIKAIQEMEALDIKTVIPGHGSFGKKEDLIVYRQYFEKLQTVAKQEFEKGKTLEEMKVSVKLPEYKGWAHYEDWLCVNIETAYNEISQKQHEQP